MIQYINLIWPGAGVGSWSRNFSILAPAKSSGSLRLRLHNTGKMNVKKKRKCEEKRTKFKIGEKLKLKGKNKAKMQYKE